MIAVTIFLFLVGAVLAWGFRVWILVPATLVVTMFVTMVELSLGADVLAALGRGFLIGLTPQIGYAFGLFARHALVVLRSLASRSVAMLYKRQSVDRAR